MSAAERRVDAIVKKISPVFISVGLCKMKVGSLSIALEEAWP